MRLFAAGRRHAPVRHPCQTLSSATLYANVRCDSAALSISGSPFISWTAFQTGAVVGGCGSFKRGSIDKFSCHDTVKALVRLNHNTRHVWYLGNGSQNLKRLRPEPVEELAPLDPSFIGCVRVFVGVGDVWKPVEVQQEGSLQQNIPARAAAYAP